MDPDQNFDIYIMYLNRIKHDDYARNEKEIVRLCDDLISELRALRGLVWRQDIGDFSLPEGVYGKRP